MAEEIAKRIKEHEEIAEVESDGINMIFEKSKTAALIYMHDAIKSFTERLENIKGPFIPSMDIEYRAFILKLLSGIKDEYKEDVLKEVLVPNLNIPLKKLTETLERKEAEK